MSVAIIQERLLSYKPVTLLDQQNALKEIAQEVALMALSRAGFFDVAAFQGGTCLRILYGLDRFSEDLDFMLKKPDPDFAWDNYVGDMREEFAAYGFALEVKPRRSLDNAVKMAFLKGDSQGGLLVLKDLRTNIPKLNIKLEIDANPPLGSEYDLKFLDFPLAFSVLAQDPASLFAGKCHALLCREYIKGRDWYDFVWYVSRQTPINLVVLQNALQQKGSWMNKDIVVTPEWLMRELKRKISSIDWDDAKEDVARFLRQHEQPTLNLWSKSFFLSRAEKLEGYLT